MKACLIPLLLCAACVAPVENVGIEPSSECSENEDAEACGANSNCGWVEITTIQAGDDYCAFEEPRGECIATMSRDGDEACLPEPACGGTQPNPTYFAPRPDIGEEAYDIISQYTGGCLAYPVEFEPCTSDGLQPYACECPCGPGGNPALPPHLGFLLDVQSGCSDVFLYGYSESAAFALSLSVDAGYAMQVTDTEMPIDVELVAGTDVELQLYYGDDLDAQFCTDVGGQGQVDSTWTANEGSVALHIELVDGQPHASATLTNVRFQPDDADGLPYIIENYAFTDVLVGWLPG